MTQAETESDTDLIRRRAEARFELERRRAQKDLYRYIWLADPTKSRSRPLQLIADLLDESIDHPVWALISGPPRHGKTTLLKHHAVRALKQQGRPLHIAYVQYSGQVASQTSRELRKLCFADGMGTGSQTTRGRYEADTVFYWTTANGGSVTLGGPGGSYTGRGYDIVAIDDPYKNREEAESEATREQVEGLWRSTLQSRVSPATGSVFITHQRWHLEDLIGVLSASVTETWWRKCALQALSDDGHGGLKALWPDSPQWNLEALLRLRAGMTDYYWESQYQQNPRSRGSKIFREPTYYDELPNEGYQVGFGVDLASSERTSADWSVCIEGVFIPEPYAVLDEHGKPVYLLTGKLYVVDVQRKQVDAPAFALTLHSQAAKRRGSPFLWYCAGTEKPAAQFIQQRVPGFAWRPATVDKLQRAIPAAEAWNAGRIMIPVDASWSHDFVDELTKFTGVKGKDKHDDQVDALAALWDLFTKFLVQKKPRRMGLPNA